MTDEAKPLEFDIRDVQYMISHWFLQKMETVELIAETPEWKNDHKMVARVTVNGVELDFKSLDDFLLECYEREMAKVKDSFADQRVAAERAAEEILKTRAKGILEHMDKLEDALRDSANLIEPYWEREEKLKSLTIAIDKKLLMKLVKAVGSGNDSQCVEAFRDILDNYPNALKGEFE